MTQYDINDKIYITRMRGEDVMNDEKSLNALICGSCGNEMKKSDKFCGKCGSKNEFYSESIGQPEKKNTKLPKIVIITAAIILVAFFSFKALAKTFFPDKYIKIAILNTYEAISKDSKSYNEIPGIIPLLSVNDVFEKELYLEINDFSDSYISSMLSGYGAKFNLQNDVNKGEMRLNMAIQDNSINLVTADLFASKDGFFVNAPLLYDNPVGVNAKADLSSLERNSYYDDMRITLLTQSKLFNASIESKKAIKDSLKNFSKDMAGLTKFEKSKNSDNTYTATIKGNDLFNAFKNNAVKLLEDKSILDFVVYSVYLENYHYSSFEEAKEYAMYNIEDAKDMLDELNSEAFEINDVNITISVNNDNLVKSMSAEINLSDEYGYELAVELSGNFDYKKSCVDSEIDLGFSTDYDSANFIYEVENSKNDNTNYRDTNLILKESGYDLLNVKLNESYDNSSKEYQGTVNIVPQYADEGFDIKIGAEYNGKDTLNFKDISFGFYDYGYYEFNLEGYLKSKNIKSVDAVKFNKIEYINEMSDSELVDMAEKIYSKLGNIFSDLDYIL